ncbi:Clp protease N-terminal domain-containing protein [Rubripirellula lacrimiformis]|uniref:Clp protease N-terminal domain-containing protein n=1 Tax=Rubripirellula lacrimiformis TaxID=1930273 RepID=UPI0011A3D1E6|nr:Clp protease N-terminal domain-containing protein [Rubripirellula lacrimiformis]
MNAKVYSRFNASAVRTMRYANQAARRLRHDYIASEHILIGLIRNRGCPAHRLLARLGVTRAAIVHELRKHMAIGDSLADKRRRPIRPDAHRVVGSAASCADRLCHESIATEHILLALLATDTGVSSRAFAGLGLVYDDVLGLIAYDLGVTLNDAEKPEP